jgi:hypothetical protein
MTMNLLETTKLIIWVNQFDPFVQANDAAADIWLHSMSPLRYEEAEEAIVQHYRANPGVKAEPGAILKRALQIRASREAGNRAAAIEPAPQPVKHPLSWRARNPELWDQLFEEGRKQGNEERRQATERRRGNQEPDHTDWMAA